MSHQDKLKCKHRRSVQARRTERYMVMNLGVCALLCISLLCLLPEDSEALLTSPITKSPAVVVSGRPWNKQHVPLVSNQSWSIHKFNHNSHTRKESSSQSLAYFRRGTSGLRMSSVPVQSGVSVIAGVISGGLFAGSLHAIAGPDHLAALLPRCCGQRWFRAARIGFLWAMGHGAGAFFLGVCAFALKNRLSRYAQMPAILHGFSSVMEIAVGLSLVLIGVLGIKESQEWKEEMETPAQSLSAAAVDPGIKHTYKRAVIFNGLLHGFSWDGAPSLAPAIAVATWKGNLTFLFSYALGTMAAMTISTTLIGEGTVKAGEIFKRPDIPQKLSFVSSLMALLVGAFWVGLAIVK